MGKLRFTLTYIVFWIILVFSCLLAENFAILSTDHMGGMSLDSILFLTIFVIVLLLYYYYREHKDNQVTFDKVLLPVIGIFGLVSILTIWWQMPTTFTNPEDGFTASVSFSLLEKFSYSLQVIVWCGVLYALLFVANRYSISKKWLKWLAFAYVMGVLACSIADVIMEFDDIAAIFTSTYDGSGLQFIIYNSNVWGHILLVGLLSCVVLSLDRFKVYYYLIMIHLFIMIIFTSCATAVFVGLAALVTYSLFEIFSLFNKQRRKSLTLLTTYFVGILLLVALFVLMVGINVSFFSNFWFFINKHILQKDYSTLTSRTGIWASVFSLLLRSPVNFIFGLGYKTGNITFTQYFLTYHDHGFAVRSAHNGVIELFLRHGVFGLLFYFAMLALFFFGIIKLLMKKQYRVAYFYALCVVGLLTHSIAESTMFFTPNIGGTYITLVFLLPVINATKEKHFAALNSDLQRTKTRMVSFNKKDIFRFINLLIIGSIIAVGTSLIIRYINSDVATLIVYLVILGVLVLSLFATPLFAILKDKESAKEALSSLLLKPLKDNYFLLLAMLIEAVIFAIVFPLVLTFDLFSSLLFTLFIFILFNFAYSLFLPKESYPLFLEFNNQFTHLLKEVSSEAENE